MEITFRRLQISRARPLTISRGTYGSSVNLFVTVTHGGKSGLGEAATIGYGREQNASTAEHELTELAPALREVAPYNISQVEALASEIGSAARSALVNACMDWLGKQAGMPLYQLLGLDKGSARTSITVGINNPEVVRELAPQLLSETNTNLLKLKLGGTDGIEADKARFMAACENTPPGTRVRVDANGGWSVKDAAKMISWLCDNGCDYVEQPLGLDGEDGLSSLMQVRRIPIFVDEFVSTSKDVPRFIGKCDGVNVKLMKAGGIPEAMRIVHTARAHGLSTMIGCFGETSIGIAAGVQIAALFDHIDLDSQLNMAPDPAKGLDMINGIPTQNDTPGLGVQLA